MNALHIDLQDGFRADSVVIEVGGDTVYEDGDVTTSLLLGVADSFEVTVEGGTQRVDVQLPDRGIRSSISIDAEQNAYLGVSVENGEVVYRPSDEPFGYM